MKRVLIQFVLFCFCSCVSWGAFTYTISNTYEYGVSLHNSESLLVTGKGADQIDAYDNSYVEVRGTGPLQLDVGGIGALALNHNSSLHFYDGEMSSLWIYGNSTAVFESGRIDYIRSFQYVYWLNGQPVDQHIEMIVKNYSYNTSTKKLTGTWADDTTFNIQLYNQTGYDTVINNIKFTVIPEPAGLAFLALGGLVLRRKK